MAKKVTGLHQAAGAGRLGQSVAADRAGARPARPQHHGVLQGVQRQAPQQMEKGMPIPVVITAYQDRSFTFEMKQPPVSYFLKQASGIKSGVGDGGQGHLRRAGHAGADRRDRGQEDARPQLRHPRGGERDDRRLRPLDGPGGGGVGHDRKSASSRPARASIASSSIPSRRRWRWSRSARAPSSTRRSRSP